MSQIGPDPIAADRAAFKALLPGLLEAHHEKYALIKDGALVDVFDRMDIAYEAGVDRFGLERFFIGHVTDKPYVHSVPALTSGVLRARL